jgi:cephalosporin-C deacetylase-like acetyl esterase
MQILRRLFPALLLPLGFLVVTGPVALAQPAATETNYSLIVRAERPNAIYRQGEEVSFQVNLAQGNSPVDEATVDWVISKDGVPPTNHGSAKVANGLGIANGKLNEPGFLLCRATYKTPQGGTLTAFGGAGVDPLHIKPSLPAPDDFDEFWRAQKQRLAGVPVQSKLRLVRPSKLGVESFDVQVDCVGAPVSGYYSSPADAKSGSLPAILLVHGAGVRSADLGSTVNWARDGFVALDINAHGIPNGKPPEFYTDLANGELKGYSIRGRDSRDTFYFLGMYLRVIRALDFLALQPEWDGRTLVVRGSSQGGAQAIAAAGLDSRVSFFAAMVPAMCDHTGAASNRISGWPKLVPNGPDGKPDPKVTEVARYFDGMNFASRARAPAIFTVGFIDTTCPPTSVYAAYNALKSPKTIYNDPPSKHENTPGSVAAVREAILAHVKSHSAATTLYTRSFKLDPLAFEERLRKFAAQRTNSPPAPAVDPVPRVEPKAPLKAAGSDSPYFPLAACRDYLKSLGVDLNPPKSIYFKDRQGILVVRATLGELDVIESLIRDLGKSPSRE